MSKLKLTNIHKLYRSGEIVHSLKDISLEFKENGFVSVLGLYGCGTNYKNNNKGSVDR